MAKTGTKRVPTVLALATLREFLYNFGGTILYNFGCELKKD